MQRRPLSLTLLVAVLFLGAIPLHADSVPLIQGRVTGIELCEQDVCGSAIFVGLFGGQVGSNLRSLGSVAVAVKHEPLPPPGGTADITGGLWQLQLLSGRKFAGDLTGGTLHNNSDGTFDVVADMRLLAGGVPGGTLTFEGTLSHNTFPPTISGAILQEPSQ
jgi:hypothetical protein